MPPMSGPMRCFCGPNDKNLGGFCCMQRAAAARPDRRMSGKPPQRVRVQLRRVVALLHAAVYAAQMDEVVRSRTWLRERRQQLRAQISQLEDQLLDAGLAPAGTVAIPDDGDDYARLVEPFEHYLSELRAQAFRSGHHPAAVHQPERHDAAAPGPARSHGAPADWLDRLADAQRAQAAAETRAIRAEAARVSAEQLQVRTSAALSHLYSAVAQLAGPAEVQGQTDHTQDEPAGGTSTIAATRTVLLAFGMQQPVTAAQVGEAVSRVLGSDANPATIRSNLVRLRDASAREGGVAVAHDDELGVWWLADPEDPSWRPPRGLRAVATEH